MQTYVGSPFPSRSPGSGAPDSEAVAEALRHTQRLTRRWVRRLPAWMDREAFLGEAFLAVAVAARNYRADREISFLDYAHTCVRRALVREAQRQDPAGRDRRHRIRAGRETALPSDLPPLSYEFLLERGDTDLMRAEIDPAPGPEASMLWAETLEFLSAALKTLRRRDRYILYLRYWEGLTRATVAATLGISGQRVQNIERRILRHLRKGLPDEGRVTMPLAF